MNIAILGNGKMGKKISKIAKNKGHKIIGYSNSSISIDSINFEKVDVAIEFSSPKIALQNIKFALKNKVPVVCGTTGWLNEINQVHDLCNSTKGAFLYSSNFSVGANIFFKINELIGNMIHNLQFNCEIEETHHTEKIDTPSGTALTIKNIIEPYFNNDIKIISNRIDKTIGEHQVKFNSVIDEIQIKHIANNRDGFAIGAITAAEWIINKTGIFSFNDVIKI